MRRDLYTELFKTYQSYLYLYLYRLKQLEGEI